VSAVDCAVTSSTASSTSPVGSFGLTASAPRATTIPVIVTTLSSRSPEAASKLALVAFTTHWVMPWWSRRSMKRRLP
jgi:hypothetical protein